MSKENINKEAEEVVEKFLDKPFVKNVGLGLKTVVPLAGIYIPLGLSTYILHTQDDRIVLGIGVALGLLGVVNTIKTAFTAVSLANKSKRRK